MSAHTDMSQAVGRDGRRPPYLPPPIKVSTLPKLVEPQSLPHPRVLAHQEALTAVGRRNVQLERYERKRRELLALRQEILGRGGGGSDGEDEDEDGQGDGWEVVEGLRASLATKRRDIGDCKAEVQRLLMRIDGQDAELQRLRPMAAGLSEQNSSLRHNLRLHQKREMNRTLEESVLRDQLEMSLSEERGTELGQTLEEKSQQLLQREKALSRAKASVQKLQVKLKATESQLAKERQTLKRLRESPQQRQIEQKLAHMRREDAAAATIQAKARGDKTREEAANAMRMASRIQAVQRSRLAREKMRADAMALVAHIRVTRQQALDTRKELAQVESSLRERQRTLEQRSQEVEKVEGKLAAGRRDMTTLKSQLREARLSLSALGRLAARANASNFLQRLTGTKMTEDPTPERQAIVVSEALSAAAETLFEAATPAGGGAPPMLFSEEFVGSSPTSVGRRSGRAGGLAIALPGEEEPGALEDGEQAMMSPSSALLERTIDQVDSALEGLLSLRASLGQASFEDPLRANCGSRSVEINLEQ